MKIQGNTLKRYLTAAIAVPIAAILIEFGPPLIISAIIFIIALIASYEYQTILSKQDIKIRIYVFLLAVALQYYFFHFFGWQYAGLALFYSIILISLSEFFSNDSNEKRVQRILAASFGLLFISFSLGHLIFLRNIVPGNDELGRDLIFYIFGTVWIADTFAYHIGKKYGKHKMAPSISPGKTWEGFFACIIGGIISSILWGLWLELGFKFIYYITLGIILPILGHIGDLTESIFKRSVNIKDSSSILPGHGGFFDRMDSMFFTAPIFFYIIKLYIL